jgi:uncharacterized membrane protein YphA (DoxX/SURF4 family)
MKQPKKSLNTYNPALASLIIRIGLAAVFIYAAIDALREPDAWISYIPSFIPHYEPSFFQITPAKITLDIVSVFQLVLAALLLIGRYVKYAAAISAALLAGIVVFNFSTFLITFRDVGLVAAAVALVFLDKQ